MKGFYIKYFKFWYCFFIHSAQVLTNIEINARRITNLSVEVVRKTGSGAKGYYRVSGRCKFTRKARVELIVLGRKRLSTVLLTTESHLGTCDLRWELCIQCRSKEMSGQRFIVTVRKCQFLLLVSSFSCSVFNYCWWYASVFSW